MICLLQVRRFAVSSEVPLLHFLFHVNALFLQQLPLSEGPVHGLGRCFGTRGPLPLCSGLHGVVEPEHVAFTQDDSISCRGVETAAGIKVNVSHTCCY